MPDALTFIAEHLAPAMLVICRIGGLALFGPVLGSSAVPLRIRIATVFLIGIVAYPILPAETVRFDEVSLSLASLAPLAAREVLLGAVIGYIASLPLLAAQTGGLIMGQQIGLGFAQLYNPTIDDEGDVIGQLLFFMALAMFLISGGLDWMFMGVVRSFDHVPIGGFSADIGVLAMLNAMLLSSLELALRIAAPLLAIVFLETVAMGFIAKTVPQLNILSLGFPLRIIVGTAAIAMGLLVIADVCSDAIYECFSSLFAWLDGFGST